MLILYNNHFTVWHGYRQLRCSEGKEFTSDNKISEVQNCLSNFTVALLYNPLFLDMTLPHWVSHSACFKGSNVLRTFKDNQPTILRQV